MSITITSNYSNPQASILDKYNNIFKKTVDDKAVVLKNSTSLENISARDLSAKDMREYLTADEKRVLKEVFGDLNVDKNTTNPYNSTRYSDFLKGTQLDVKL
jgi:hypothetical protein